MIREEALMKSALVVALLVLPLPAAIASSFLFDDWIELDGSASGGGVSSSDVWSTSSSIAVGKEDWPTVAWMEWVEEENTEIFLRQWDGDAWIGLGGSASDGGLSMAKGQSSSPCVAMDK